MSASLRDGLSQQLAHHGDHALCFAPQTIIAGFLPIRSEVDLQPLMQTLRKKGAQVCLPVVLDRQTICFRLWPEGADLINTGFGTRGPGPDAAVVDPDILLIPLSAFDRRGNRIGYGAGHYDRAIARLHQKGCNPTLIGIAFDCQEVAHVPFEPHDVALHAILTESGYKNFKT
ncbi:5-formyltetrahydrofolate cyclo-ligase [Agrobacterium vitis]|nr:5-formyltetrahydrofolate cyclo-ligase [Agrobacterium vitis]MBE1436880.1 5-formyltetrahydrofolate cyclo-ligase [Agrobacterium vitis]